MQFTKSMVRVGIVLVMFAGATAIILAAGPGVAGQTSALGLLEKKFQREYAAIQRKFAQGPERGYYSSGRDEATLERNAAERRERVGKWQDELADRFAAAAATAAEIIELNPANLAVWQEHRDALLLYAQPISPPETRTVYGSTEVQQRARIFNKPLAVYPEEARHAKAKGEVRLRLVLAADGTVKHIFPTKPSKHGFTEAAIAAARSIEFEPAIRDGHRASQFVSLVYKFKDGQSLPPFVPTTVFE